MLNKNLIIKNFKKSINTYDENAIVQQKIADELVSLINKKKYDSILEIGSYSGLLTKKITKNFAFDSYLALDIIDSFDFIKNLSPKIKFQKIDVENFSTNQKFDLIVSSSSLQWCENFNYAVENLKSCLNHKGTIAISIFGKNNLYEIKEAFNISLNYPDINEIKKIFSPSAKIVEKTYTLNFKTPKEALLHLKLTGVNSISKNQLSIKKIKEKMKILNDKFKNRLTYNPVFIIFELP